MRALVLVDPAPQQLCLALVQHDQHGEPGEGGHFQLIFMFASKFPAQPPRAPSPRLRANIP